MAIIAGILVAMSLWTGAIAASKIQDIEAYLNALQTLESDFHQVNDDQTEAQGHFYLARNQKKLKFEYAEPQGYFILAKDGWLMFYDPSLKDFSYLEVEFSPAKFFLQNEISFSKGVTFKDYKEEGEEIWVSLTDENRTALVSLLFQKSPLRLRGWRILDGQNKTTEVRLNHIHENQKIDEGVFHHKKLLKGVTDR